MSGHAWPLPFAKGGSHFTQFLMKKREIKIPQRFFSVLKEGPLGKNSLIIMVFLV